jgi:enoyl-CoA hydratase
MTTGIRVERSPLHATLWLDRPDKHNPLSVAMWDDLAGTIRTLSADDRLRCVIIRGAGGRAFSAGADIAEFEATRGSVGAARTYGARINACMAAITDCRHPIVAAIEGICVGGGVEIATHCDLRYANAPARFGIPVKRLGLSVDAPEMTALIRLVGPSTALELLLEGRILDAEEAGAKGLVNRIFPDLMFQAELAAVIARICEGAPLVARMHKRMARRLALEAAFTDLERDEPLALFGTNDYRIGYTAFLAKTNPVFTGS